MPLVTCIVDTDGTGDYLSLNAAEADNFGATSADLVANDEWVECDCQCTSGSADTVGGTIIADFITDETHGIKIWCDPASGFRHSGAWDATKYRQEHTDNLRVSVSVTIDGIQTHIDGSLWTESDSGNEIWFTSLIIRHSFEGGNATRFNGDNTPYWYFCNNIVYGDGVQGGRGVSAASNDAVRFRFYNNIIYNFAEGLDAKYRDSLIEAVNNAVFNCGDDFVRGDHFAVCDYNASDDGDGTNAVTPADWSTVFEDPATGDFRLIDGAPLIDAGTDLSAEITAVDITGETSRPQGSAWDIGAFEYVQDSAATWNIGGVSGASNISGVDNPSEIGGVS